MLPSSKTDLQSSQKAKLSLDQLIWVRTHICNFLGFLIDVGTRDENEETSGSLLALKNTYLKTLKHTNETINYGMIQMSGGDMTMDYDQERTYFRG
jgi:hypothetical protein